MQVQPLPRAPLFIFDLRYTIYEHTPGCCCLNVRIPLVIAMLHFAPERLHFIAQIGIGSVWMFHGLYSKVLNGIPRHRLIVGKILGTERAGIATKTIGLLELLLGVWAFTGWRPVWCASVQTVALIAMNSLEIILAHELLISAIGMVVLNLGFLSLVWWWATFAQRI